MMNRDPGIQVTILTAGRSFTSPKVSRSSVESRERAFTWRCALVTTATGLKQFIVHSAHSSRALRPQQVNQRHFLPFNSQLKLKKGCYCKCTQLF